MAQRIEIMSPQKIQIQIEKAQKEKLLIQYALSDQRYRVRRILLETTETYFVVCDLRGENIKVILVAQVLELISLPHDPEWKNALKQSYRDLIVAAEKKYACVKSSDVLDRQKAIAGVESSESLPRLISRLKKYVLISSDKVKFLKLMDEIEKLLN